MKKKIYNRFYQLFIACFSIAVLVSCGGDSGRERRTDEDRGIVNEEALGGRPSESSALVRGVFRDGRQQCQEGFGLCDVEIHPQTDQNVGLDTLTEQGAALYPATFILDTEDKNSMRIEFNQRIPFFQNQFVVDSTQRGFSNIFGADSVFVVPGIYNADQTLGDFGAVEVKIVRRGVQEPIN